MIMKIKIKISFVALILLSFFANASIVDTTKAKLIGKNYCYEILNIDNKVKYDDVQLNFLYTEESNSEPVYYVFNIQNKEGYIIISADDNAFPVLAYSFKGNYNINEEKPPAFIEWMNNYKQQINYIRQNNTGKNKTVSTQWKKYSFKPDISVKNSKETLGPLLTTTWNQGCYYNTDCPADAGPCGHVWTGCVATAMAQVMKYHNYPPQGTGSLTYSCPPYGSLSADFGNTVYGWGSMPNSLSGENSEVAQLMYHCGVSVYMDYGTSGSGAWLSSVSTALKNYFSYSITTHLSKKVNYTEAEWENMLTDELNADRPLAYAGGNHAFVCDGYQGASNNHFYFNWGWGGSYDGYFYVSSLTPGSYDFTYNQKAVFGAGPPVPIVDFKASKTIHCPNTTVFLYDMSLNTPTSWEWEITPNNFIYVNSTNSSSQNPEVQFSVLDTFTVSLKVTNFYGADSITFEDYIIINTGVSYPFYEDFEAEEFPPPGWGINNPNGDRTWQRRTPVGGNDPSIASALVYNFNGGLGSGQIDDFITPNIDLSGAVNPLFSFKVAYKQVPEHIETLKVFISTDCGETYNITPIFNKAGSELATIISPPFGYGDFVPENTSDWRLESIDLTLYADQEIVLKFESTHNGYENVYIDDVRIAELETPTVNFTASSLYSCSVSDTFIFTDLSTDLPATWQWTFLPNTVTYVNSTNENSQNPQVMFSAFGDYTVSLTAGNIIGSNTETKNNYIKIGALSLPFTEDFESGSFKTNFWEIDNPGLNVTWDLLDTISSNPPGTTSAFMYNFNNFWLEERDAMITPALDFTGYDTLSLIFKHAYTRGFMLETDSLIIYISPDCGNTWTRVWAGGEDGTGNFATAPHTNSPFFPSSVDDWCGSGVGSPCNNIDLIAWAGNPSIQVKFENFNVQGNNLFIDDIEITGTIITGIKTENPDILKIYPNPTNDFINIEIAGKGNIEIININGQVLYSKEYNKPQQIDISDYPKGIYFVKFKSRDIIKVEKLVISS